MKRLTEALSAEHKLTVSKLAMAFLKEQVALYDGKHLQMGDLGIWLASLKALYTIHQTHHWQTMGSTFYGDHLLLERLYKAVQDEIDTVGEKLVSLDSPAVTNYFIQTRHSLAFLQAITLSDKPPMVTSFIGELVFIEMGELIKKRLEEAGLLTSGLANMMEDILDRHESHVYLLQQRTNLR